MTQFKLKISSFSICWLRAYDFGLDKQDLERSILSIKKCPLVDQVRRVAAPEEVDEIDSRMFDIRYQERSELIRIRFYPCNLIRQRLGNNRTLSASLMVDLLLDIGSGFGVFNITLHPSNRKASDTFNMEEVVFLTRQWILVEDEKGEPVRLNIRLPQSNEAVSLYIREIMNFYYLQLHRTLWEITKNKQNSPLQDINDLQSWIHASREKDPRGCVIFHELQERGFIRTLFPTSFGPVLDIWRMQDINPIHFDADEFSKKYSNEISWFLTDGQRATLGTSLHNQRQAKILALYIWPNHALYINQSPKAISHDRTLSRVKQYGCLDVEIVRILEILNLQGALNHAFDKILDHQLAEVNLLAAKEQQALVKITEQRRNISRSLRSFDFYNLFHTAYWESLYARLLENPYLRFRDVASLIEIKSARLDEEIQQAIIVQDRARQQQQREQQLGVLRGLHRLSLLNDIQNTALMTINFIVSATASFAFLEVLEPWLTQWYSLENPFRQVYPLGWIGLNVGTFLFLTLILSTMSNFVIRRKNRVIELDGQLNLPYDTQQLEYYLARQKNLDYYYFDRDDKGGFLRFLLPKGTLSLEFDHRRFIRFILFLQGEKTYDSEQLKKIYVDVAISRLHENRVILPSNEFNVSQ
jgi:hypothetical protein